MNLNDPISTEELLIQQAHIFSHTSERYKYSGVPNIRTVNVTLNNLMNRLVANILEADEAALQSTYMEMAAMLLMGLARLRRENNP